MDTNNCDSSQQPSVQVAPLPEPARSTPAVTKKTIKELAAEHTDAALKTIYDVMNSDKSGPMTKLAAANALLDRGHGKPTQYVEQQTKVLTYQDLLSSIRAKEEKYSAVVEAQEVEELPSGEPELDWGDLI